MNEIITSSDSASSQQTDRAATGSAAPQQIDRETADVAGAITTHTYPRALHESKLLFRLFHAAVAATTLRNWYVRAAIRRLVRRQPPLSPPLRILDVGCGAGDHLFYAARLRRDVQGMGIDRAEDAVNLCRAQAPGRARLAFRKYDLEEAGTLPEADFIFCITVLQYIQDDLNLVKKMRDALKPGGRLLLYVPIRNERTLGLHDHIISGSRSDYDAAQDRRRIYERKDVEKLLTEAGFEIESADEAYGRFGKLAFEIHSILLHGLAHETPAIRAAAGVAGVVLLPPILALTTLDYAFPVKRGNGLLIVAS